MMKQSIAVNFSVYTFDSSSLHFRSHGLQDPEAFSVSAGRVGQHGNRHHKVLAARGQVVGVQSGSGRPAAATAFWASHLIRSCYVLLDVHNLPDDVGWVPRVLLGEEGDRFLGQEVV
jgi:hypothetical protein